MSGTFENAAIWLAFDATSLCSGVGKKKLKKLRNPKLLPKEPSAFVGMKCGTSKMLLNLHSWVLIFHAQARSRCTSGIPFNYERYRYNCNLRFHLKRGLAWKPT